MHQGKEGPLKEASVLDNYLAYKKQDRGSIVPLAKPSRDELLAAIDKKNEGKDEEEEEEEGETRPIRDSLAVDEFVLRKQVLTHQRSFEDIDKRVIEVAEAETKSDPEKQPALRSWKRHETANTKYVSTRPSAPDTHHLTDRLELAVQYVRDAKKGRQTVAVDAGWKRKLYKVHYNHWFLRLLFLTMFIHMTLVFFERPSASSKAVHAHVVLGLLIFELLLVLILLADVVMKAAYLGRAFFTKVWNLVAFTLVFLFLGDVIAGLCGATLHISRFLRPLYLVARWRRLRSAIRSIRRTVTLLVPIVMVSFSFITVFSIGGVQLFRGWYPQGNIPSSSFDHLPSAWLTMLVMLSGEQYPDVMLPALERSPFFSLYFVVFFSIGVYLLLNVVVAVLFNSYTDMRKESVVYDRWKERTSLNLAFEQLDHQRTGKIGWDTWQSFLNLLLPKANASEVRQLFTVIAVAEREHEGRSDTDDPHKIGVLSFFEILDVLLLRFTYAEEHDDAEEDCFHKSFPALLSVVNLPIFSQVVGVIVLLNGVALCLVHEGMPSDMMDVIFVVDCVFAALMMVEVVLRVLAHSVHGFFSHVWNTVDFLLVILAAVAVMCQLALGASRDSVTWRVLAFMSSLKLARVITAYEALRIPVETLLRIMPAMATTLSLISCCLYAYAVVGMELFYSAYPREGDGVRPNFTSFGWALLTLFQTTSPEGWSDVMYEGMLYSSPLSVIYFVSFHLIVVLFFVNLLVAGIVEMFVLLREIDNSALGMFSIETDDGHVITLQKRRRLSRDLIAGDAPDVSDEEIVAKMRLQSVVTQAKGVQVAHDKFMAAAHKDTQAAPPNPAARAVGPNMGRRPSVKPVPMFAQGKDPAPIAKAASEPVISLSNKPATDDHEEESKHATITEEPTSSPRDLSAPEDVEMVPIPPRQGTTHPASEPGTPTPSTTTTTTPTTPTTTTTTTTPTTSTPTPTTPTTTTKTTKTTTTPTPTPTPLTAGGETSPAQPRPHKRQRRPSLVNMVQPSTGRPRRASNEVATISEIPEESVDGESAAPQPRRPSLGLPPPGALVRRASADNTAHSERATKSRKRRPSLAEMVQPMASGRRRPSRDVSAILEEEDGAPAGACLQKMCSCDTYQAALSKANHCAKCEHPKSRHLHL